MLHIVLADSELETVPKELWSHPSVSKQARRRGKRPGNMVLDSNFHHAAISRYFPGEENRRGRPDIVQYFLLNTLESPLNIYGKLSVYVHTRKNQVIFVDPATRLPKS
ncbi:MAG TPA: 16S rRNA methyltransferase, partial [Euryarchaeota archaeon]|nr:16S rRNA methyltransferase [Euryarchaeota archaeon]